MQGGKKVSVRQDGNKDSMKQNGKKDSVDDVFQDSSEFIGRSDEEMLGLALYIPTFISKYKLFIFVCA